MNFRMIFAAMVAVGFSAAVVAEEPQTVTYRLRNLAAADAAQALTRFAEQKTMSIRIVVEPSSNTLLLSAESAQLKQATEALSALDVEPLHVHVQMMLVRVPAGFAEDIGLGSDNKWVLTPREVSMLNAAIRRQKSAGSIDVLSRPAIMTLDNQTAQVQVGNAETGVAVNITPRVSADGGILLRLEAQVKETSGQVINVQSIETTEAVRDGGTFVVRGMHSKDSAGNTEILTVLTAGLVKPNPK
jgi:type II secretory pathway component GspD/PulD (secretin)